MGWTGSKYGWTKHLPSWWKVEPCSLLLANGLKSKFSVCFCCYLCDFWCIVCLEVIVLLCTIFFFFFFSPCSHSFLHNKKKKKKKSLVAIKKCKNLMMMMLQVFWILSWSVQLRESRLGIKQECAVGANQLVTEPHWVTESKARPATWASADSYHHHPTHGCSHPRVCAYFGIRWLKQHILEIQRGDDGWKQPQTIPGA